MTADLEPAPPGPAEEDAVLVIAEAGVNHDGSVEIALELIDAAAESGADAVKFQTFRTDLLVSATAPQAAYQRERALAASQAEMLRGLELPEAAYADLRARAEERGLEFLSTAFDAPSLDLLLSVGITRVKIPSGDLTNGPLLLAASETDLPIILSTGMATMDEVAEALGIIAVGVQSGRGEGMPPADRRADRLARALAEGILADRVTILHCTSAYPAPVEAVNLRAMLAIRDRFGLPVGYSDHTSGTDVAVAAAVLGASVIEKHLTLDRSRPGPDHAASLDPDGFRRMVDGIRSARTALGSPIKAPSDAELDVRRVARRSLHAARDLAAGAEIAADDLVALRPGGGLPPNAIWDLVGANLRRSYVRGEMLDASEAAPPPVGGST